MEEKTLTTPNKWAAAHAIQKTGCRCKYEDQGSMMMFALPDTEDVRQALRDFNMGGLVPAIEYAEIAKRLTHELHQAKEEKGMRYGQTRNY